jgi:predicted RNA-binding protein
MTMCESNVYLISNGQEQMIMESVDIIEPIGKNEWNLVSMFGERTTIKARFKSMQLIDHKVLFEA